MHELPIAITRSDLSGLTWIALQGDLDLGGVGLVGGDLQRACDERSHVVLDTRGLGFLDLAGLRLVADLERRMRDRGARLSIIAGPLLTRLARLVELDAVLAAADQEPDALLGLADAGAGVAGAAPSSRPDPGDASGALRALVASECARQHDLVDRMVTLTGRARTVLEAVHGTNRAVAAGRARRAAGR